MDIKSSKPVSLSEVREILEKRAGEGELGYEQEMALEHAKKFSSEDSKKVQKLAAALTKNGKISEEVALKLVDITPKDAATVKAILSKERIEASEEELNQIIKELS